MCGIAGFTQFYGPTGNTQTLERMGKAIEHRGPDAHGSYIDEKVGLCHQRLSIIDLSEAGTQPIFSDDDNLVIVFNGEIYNFPSLREDLVKAGYAFKTRTDTEVIIALYQSEGVDCLKKLNGMFAIAIWDKAKEELFLARDRIGKKPLYYYNNEKDFIFASEIKAILAVPGIPKKVREDALYDYLTYLYVPEPKTIFEDIFKLEPGHWLLISADKVEGGQYWELSFAETMNKSKEEVTDEVFNNLKECVERRMISDVPLGAFLSGGVDSSAVVGLMAQKEDKPVTTCSIGFDSKKFDEVQYAQQVADIYKTEHHEFTVKENLVEHIEHIAKYFDEPFADSSMIPTYFVSKLAREKVTVALAGDGGDENFAGYSKYAVDHIENELRKKFPSFLKRHVFPIFARLLKNSNQKYLKKAFTLLDTLSRSPARGFFLTNSFLTDKQWSGLAKPSLKAKTADYHPSFVTEHHYHQANTDDHLSKLLYVDIKTFLPGDILVKVDRMSMANSLEVRAPMLDYEFVEMSAKIPSSLKFHEGDKKHILKEASKKLLPDDILYRKKQGFSVPLAQWFRSDIKGFAQENLLSSDSGINHYFELAYISQLWEEHQEEIRDHSTLLWSLLMFELWWQHYMKGSHNG